MLLMLQQTIKGGMISGCTTQDTSTPLIWTGEKLRTAAVQRQVAAAAVQRQFAATAAAAAATAAGEVCRLTAVNDSSSKFWAKQQQ
jgi:hypothetical protein